MTVSGHRGTVVFRADASPEIGGGHVVRCLALADGLAARGWRCIFATIAETTGAVPALAGAGHALVELDQGTVGADAVGAAVAQSADWLVTDHYGIDAGFQRGARTWAREIAAVDELADRPLDCDLLVDQTPGREPAAYDGLVPDHARVLSGPQYALLRPAFATGRDGALQRRECTERAGRVLVSFGAIDARNLAGRALEGIHASGIAPAVDVVLGGSAPHLAAVEALAAGMAFPVTLHLDAAADDMAALMAAADLALGAAGTTSWERCCMGLAALVVVDADNQALFANRLQDAGAARVLGTSDAVGRDDIAAALADLHADAPRLRRMATAAAGLCDGRGVERVAEAMEAA